MPLFRNKIHKRKLLNCFISFDISNHQGTDKPDPEHEHGTTLSSLFFLSRIAITKMCALSFNLSFCHPHFS